jgi:hypothetical protein
MSLRDDEKKTTYSSFGLNNSKHLSVNNMNITTSSSSMLLGSTLASSGNDLANKSFLNIKTNTNTTSPVLSNLSSNLSSPINSPFSSSFNSPSNVGSPHLFNSNNTSVNDYNNANILANTSMESSFSFNNNTTGIGHANTYSGSINNFNTGTNPSNSIFNMNNLTSAINEDINGNTSSPLFSPSTPSNNLARSATINNPFSTPLNNNGSPSSFNNPFGTPSNGIKQLTFESSSPISTSNNISYHAPISSNATNSTTSWINTFNSTTNDNFNSSTPMMSPTAPPMVTNLTGIQSIHSASNPFEGIH